MHGSQIKKSHLGQIWPPLQQPFTPISIAEFNIYNERNQYNTIYNDPYGREENMRHRC